MVAELDRPLGSVPKVVEVKGAVARRGVVAVAVAASPVVGVRELRHRRVVHRANLVDEGVVGAARVAADARLLRPRRLEDQRLLFVENLDEVLDLRRGHPLRPDVDVEPRAAVDLRVGFPHRPHHLLEGVHVAVAHDRRDHFGARSPKAAVAHDVPLASVGHRHHPVVEVVAFVSRRAARDLRDHLGRPLLADSLVLEFAPVGEARQFCFRYRHLLVSCFSVFVCVPRGGLSPVGTAHMMP